MPGVKITCRPSSSFALSRANQLLLGQVEVRRAISRLVILKHEKMGDISAYLAALIKARLVSLVATKTSVKSTDTVSTEREIPCDVDA